MNYHTVNLGTDYPGKITDFAMARNSFLEQLPDNQYILWKSDDEEHSKTLLSYLDRLVPGKPYYAIRRINLVNGRYLEAANPDYSPHLVSNRVRYKGRIHEKVVPRKPYGRIDLPIIHNHSDQWNYTSGWKQTGAYWLVAAVKKAFEVMRN